MAEKTEKLKILNNGDIAVVHYTGTFDNGDKFDSSEGRDPIEFEIGAGKVIHGFEDAVKSMKINEEKTIKLEAKDGYGERNPERIKPFPKDKLPKSPEPKKGMVLSFNAPDGRKLFATIDNIEADKVFLDFNHPLAGKALTFKLKLVNIKERIK